MGVNVCNSRKLSDDLVDSRVVFHGAGPERVEAGIDAEISLREPRVMAYHLGFGETGPSGGLFSHQALGYEGCCSRGQPRWLAITGIFSAVVVKQVAHAFTPECVAHIDNCAARASMSCSEV